MNTNILLVEDSPSDAAILLAAFEEIGYNGNIQVVTNGVDAIDVLSDIEEKGQDSWPQMILLDLNLPKKNGLEVLESIKENPVWMSIPTIIMSSSSSPKDIASSYQRHANAYIPKPRQLERYQQIAQQLQSFWLQPAVMPAA